MYEAIYLQEIRKLQNEEAEMPGSVVPGDGVYLREFWKKWNETRKEGPYQESEQLQFRSSSKLLQHSIVLRSTSGDVR